MSQSNVASVEGAAEKAPFAAIGGEGRDEALFRAAYGMGAEATQLEVRHRPFLTEDEALARWRGRQP